MLSMEAEGVLETLFTMEEEDASPASAEALRDIAHVDGGALLEMTEAGLVVRDEAGFRLSAPGRPEAAIITRRHRLAERLMHDVLRITDEASESIAFECERFLEAEVADSICTLLGHPSICPHGKPIPPGDCCSGKRRGVRPVVEKLSELSVGDSGTVAYTLTTSPRQLDRLASFGLLPGAAIHVHKTEPSIVILLGETELSFDRDTSRDIYVRRSGADGNGAVGR